MRNVNPKDKWDILNIIATLILSIASIVVVFMIGRWQLNISQLQENTTRKQAMSPLIVSLGSKEESVRRASARGLLGFGTWAVEPLMDTLHDKDSSFHEEPIEALAKLHNEENVRINEQLLQELEFAQEDAISSFVRLLFMIEARNWHSLLIGKLQQNPTIAKPVIEAIKGEFSTKTEDLQNFALQLSKTPLPDLRISAVEIFDSIGDKKVIKPLLQMLSDKDNNVLKKAASALAKVAKKEEPGNQEVVKGFLSTIQATDRPLAVREDVLDTIRRADWQEMRSALRELLQVKGLDTSIYVLILHIMGEKWDKDSIDPLLAALDNSEVRIRFAALTALWDLCKNKSITNGAVLGPEVKDSLAKIEQTDPDQHVKREAKNVKQKIQRQGC